MVPRGPDGGRLTLLVEAHPANKALVDLLAPPGAPVSHKEERALLPPGAWWQLAALGEQLHLHGEQGRLRRRERTHNPPAQPAMVLACAEAEGRRADAAFAHLAVRLPFDNALLFGALPRLLGPGAGSRLEPLPHLTRLEAVDHVVHVYLGTGVDERAQ